MELSEALRTIDATIGMFQDLHPMGEWDMDFLRTPVEVSFQDYVDENYNRCTERKMHFYHKVMKKNINIIDIIPVCKFLVNEWPSPQTQQLRKRLVKAYNLCYEAGKKSLDLFAPLLYATKWWEKEHYSFTRQNREKYDLYDALTDTLHEMYHAIKATKEELDEKLESIFIEEKKNYVKEIDWVRATNNFNINTIKGVVNSGRNKRERRSIIRAIRDAMIATGEMYKIPYSVDGLLMDLFKENGGSRKALLKASDESSETLFIDDFARYAIEEYRYSHRTTDANVDEIFAEKTKSVESKDIEREVPHVDNLSSSDKQIKTAVEIMKKEKVIKHLYDYAFIMKIMNETEDLPTFNYPKSFLDYFKDLGITDLPSEDSIKKKVNATFGSHPSWTFTDTKGKDANEAKRRNAVGSRFLSIYRKGK